MIPVIILDPSSLTLSFDPALISQRAGGQALLDAFELAYGGDAAGLAKLIPSLKGRPLQSRCANFVTSVWHEKRHFLDFLLTNYGALRIRQYFHLYGNMKQLLAEALQEKRELWFPLDVYLSRVHQRIFGIPTDWSSMQAVAGNMRQARELVAADRHQVGAGAESVEVGGDAQFEALAWICQLAAAQELLGGDVSRLAQEDIARFPGSQQRYRWIEHFAAGLGILPHKRSAAGREQDVSAVMPLLYAALQIRGYGQTKSVPQSAYSSLPSRRLYLLATRLEERRGSIANIPMLDAWNEISKLCKELWGRTPLEEMKEDYRFEGEFAAELSANEQVYEEVKTCFAEYHRLRGLMIDMFEEFPQSVLDTTFFARNLLGSLQPYVVAGSGAGVAGEAPGHLELIHGFYEDKQRKDGWWWAASPKHWPRTGNGIVHLWHRDAWLHLASLIAPVAKLMLNGRAHRTMLGPELLTAEMRLRSMPLEIRFDQALAFPREDPLGLMRSYYTLLDRDTVACDSCRRQIHKPEGRLLPPWLFRHNTAIADLASASLTPPGEDESAGRRRFWRDWTPWVCCDRCFPVMLQHPGFKAAFEATCVEP